jgi:DNA-binding MarR family transcriptional regulator
MSAPVLRLDNQLCFPLYAAARAVTQAYQPLLSRLGLTYPQYLVLMVLWEDDGLSVKQIGRRLYLDSGTLTPLLKRLEQAGLVRRVRGRHDERVVQLFLTAGGRRLERRAQEIPQALLCKLAMPLAEVLEVRDGVRRLLGRIHDNAGGSTWKS